MKFNEIQMFSVFRLFFDDCLWRDHCGLVSRNCREANGKGVVAVRTPSGLGEREWQRGLKQFELQR